MPPSIVCRIRKWRGRGNNLDSTRKPDPVKISIDKKSARRIIQKHCDDRRKPTQWIVWRYRREKLFRHIHYDGRRSRKCIKNGGIGWTPFNKVLVCNKLGIINKVPCSCLRYQLWYQLSSRWLHLSQWIISLQIIGLMCCHGGWVKATWESFRYQIIRCQHIHLNFGYRLINNQTHLAVRRTL